MNKTITNENEKDGTIMTKFDTMKRDLETAITNGNDYTSELQALSTAIATACVNKCIDPQRTSATTRDTISNNGHNPALLAIRREIYSDTRTLQQTRDNANNATRIVYSADGDINAETVDTDAQTAFDALIGETLGDGLDLAQEASTAILQVYSDYYSGQDDFFDCEITVRRLAKKVYIQADDSAAYKEVTTTPIQEVYREVRRAIQASRATQIDPRNGYSYIEDITPDGLDVIYRRLQKWADLGGTNRDGNYTTDAQTVTDYSAILTKLNLTHRQTAIISLRMRGYGYKAISTYLGVRADNVQVTLKRLQSKLTDLGIDPPKPDTFTTPTPTPTPTQPKRTAYETWDYTSVYSDICKGASHRHYLGFIESAQPTIYGLAKGEYGPPESLNGYMTRRAQRAK